MHFSGGCHKKCRNMLGERRASSEQNKHIYFFDEFIEISLSIAKSLSKVNKKV